MLRLPPSGSSPGPAPVVCSGSAWLKSPRTCGVFRVARRAAETKRRGRDCDDDVADGRRRVGVEPQERRDAVRELRALAAARRAAVVELERHVRRHEAQFPKGGPEQPLVRRRLGALGPRVALEAAGVGRAAAEQQEAAVHEERRPREVRVRGEGASAARVPGQAELSQGLDEAPLGAPEDAPRAGDPGPERRERARRVLRERPETGLDAAAKAEAEQKRLELVHEPEQRVREPRAEGPGLLQRDDLQVARRLALELGTLERDAVAAAVHAPKVPGAGEGDEPQVVADDVDAARERRRRHDGFLVIALRQELLFGQPARFRLMSMQIRQG